MRYVCLIYNEPARLEAMTPADWQELVSETEAFDAALTRNGQLIACERLASVDTATSVRFRGAKPSVTDGPFTETKEHLGGFLLIEARDLDEATRIAAACPPARLGGIEVRPVWA